MFEGYTDRESQSRATRGRRLAGHATAVAAHALFLFASVQLIPQRPPLPAPTLPTAVPVHVAPLYWPGRREPPRESPPPLTTAATAPSHQPARAARRVPRRTATAASPTPEPARPEVSLASAPAPVLAPAGREEGATGVVAPSPAATGIANTAANAAAGPSAPAPRSAPRFLPEPLANQQKLAGAAPDFPAHLAVNGALYVIHARICVATSGDVERIELLKTAHPTLDANVRSAVGRWRYRPLLAGAVPIPFCTLARFEFRAT